MDGADYPGDSKPESEEEDSILSSVALGFAELLLRFVDTLLMITLR